MFQDAVVTCPYCGAVKKEEMPLEYLERDYTCGSCGKKLILKESDCCVFCAYSNMICPPQQQKRNCCSD